MNVLNLNSSVQTYNRLDNDTRLGWYWSPATGLVAYYEVYAYVDNAARVLVGTTPTAPTATNPYYITGQAHRKYRLQVRAADSQGTKGPDSDISTDVVLCTPGDANYDDVVNIDDLTLVSFYWGESGDLSADIDDSGWVNIDDLTLVSFYWGEVYHSAAPTQWLANSTIGLFNFKCLVEEPNLLNIVVLVKGAKAASAAGFELIFGSHLRFEVEELTKANFSDPKFPGFFKNDRDKNRLIILMTSTKPVSGDIVLVRCRIRLDYSQELPEELTVVLRNGQLGNSLKRTSFSGVIKTIPLKPQENWLGQNYPNPFNPETWIPYQLKDGSNVEISIFTMTGQLVKKMDLGFKPADFYTGKETVAHWDGRNQAGESVASGVYFYTIRAGNFTATKKMVVER